MIKKFSPYFAVVLVLGLIIAFVSFSCSKKMVPLSPSSFVSPTVAATNTPTATNTPVPTATAAAIATPPWTFDLSTHGFTFDAFTDLAVTAVNWNSVAAGITHGAGSLALTSNFSASATSKGYVYLDLATAPLNLTGKRFSVWVNVPAGMAGYGMSMVAKLGAGKSWNAAWQNLTTAGWQKFTWDVNAADVQEIGLQFLRNNAASYTGTIYTDEWTITDTPVAPPAVYNFNTSAQGWVNDIYGDLAITNLVWDSNAANAMAGAGSVVLTGSFATATASGYFYVDLALAPVDLTGKTVDIWVNVPAAMVGYGAQVVCKTGAGKAWNAGWNNITASGWQKMTWSPNLADVREIGLQVLRNSAPAAFAGTFNVDEITYY